MLGRFGIFVYLCPILTENNYDMKYFCTFRNVLVLCLLCMTSIVAQGQKKSEGPFYVEGPQIKVDVRHLKWSDFEGIQPRRTALTRGDDSPSRWIDRIGNMPDYLIDFYQLYGTKVQEVLDGQENWLSNPEEAEYDSKGTYYVIVKTINGTTDFTFPVGSGNNVIKEAAGKAVQEICGNIVNEYTCFMNYLTLCMNYDYPEAFWTGNAANWGTGWGYGYSYNPSAGTGTVEYNMNLTFTLKGDYFDYRIAEFRDPTTLSSTVTEFKTKVNSITESYKSKTRYEQVSGLNDWLTKHNSYNSDLLQTGTAAEIAWSPMSALRESTGALGSVCEGYARAFKCLCDKLSIPCILATGNAKNSKSGAGEAHMWNEVQMDNNEWYAVDVTWNDPIIAGADNNKKVSGGENEFWLLLGQNDEVAPGFTFAESHPNTPAGDNPFQSQWDLLFESLITKTHYEVSAAITIGKSGKASYCGDKSLDFSFSEEIKAYIATGFDKDEGTIWLTRVKDVPAGVPVLIKGEAEKTYNVPVTDSQNSYYTNMFVGNTSGASIEIYETSADGSKVNYYLKNGTFLSVSGNATIGNNKCYLQLPATFNASVTGASQSVTVGQTGKASFAASVDLDFTNVEGLKAFTATGYDKSTKTIWLTRVMKVQQGEGVLLKGDPDNYEIPSVAAQSHYENMFVGNTSGATIEIYETSYDGSQTNYYLKDGTFLSVTGNAKIGNNKCYLPLPTSMVAGAASTRGSEADYKFEEPEMIKMPIDFRSLDNDGDGTTEIKVQSSMFNVQSDTYYTLQGQRVVNPGKGLYIKNGKKVVIK